MEAPPSIQFLKPIEVRALLLNPQRSSNILVLDVRDEDYDGGHINATHWVNESSYKFSNEIAVDAFIDAHLQPTIDTVIVHCYLSQQRGPLAARR